MDEGARFGAAGTVLGALIAAWAMLRGKGTSTPADAQGQINEGFKLFMAEANHRIEELEGENRNVKQYNQSLRGVLLANNLPIPLYQPTPQSFKLLTDGREEDIPV